MKQEFNEFIHPQHFGFFVEAAKTFNCHILVRKTGRASISWIGKQGYTGKRGDLKAKTANRDVGHYQVAGLVCSPFLQPKVFDGERLIKAYHAWNECAHLITVPHDAAGFDDRSQPRCSTPYFVQTNPKHRHYGCVALTDCGLLIPRYVHGDYDLYAIIPAGRPFDANQLVTRQQSTGSTMAPDHLPLEEKLRLRVVDQVGPLSFRVANFINGCIVRLGGDITGALMVNHGEQVNLGAIGQTYETVLAVMPRNESGEWARVLSSPEEHQAFYRQA